MGYSIDGVRTNPVSFQYGSIVMAINLAYKCGCDLERVVDFYKSEDK